MAQASTFNVRQESTRTRTFHQRPHRKVKSGCAECKLRKIKCDEGRPKCCICTRYSTLCIYPTFQAASKASRSPVRLNYGMVETPKDFSDQTTDLQVEDLELLHHWTMFACHGFGDKPGDEQVWQIEVPQIACKQPFLMRGILAVSALHMSRTREDQSQKYLLRAVYHQNLALPFYRYVISDFENKMTKGNCHAVIAFASLITAFAIADPRPLALNHSEDAPSPNGVPEWIHLLRGARQIFAAKRDWLIEGPMAFQLGAIDGPVDLSCHLEDARLATLKAMIDTSRPSEQLSRREIEVYHIVLMLLRESFAIPLSPSPTVGIKLSTYSWVERVPQQYFEFLEQLKPQALILLAHFSMLLKISAASYWYMEGAAERLVTAIDDVLDEEWRPWIAWPLHKVNITRKAL